MGHVITPRPFILTVFESLNQCLLGSKFVGFCHWLLSDRSGKHWDDMGSMGLAGRIIVFSKCTPKSLSKASLLFTEARSLNTIGSKQGEAVKIDDVSSSLRQLRSYFLFAIIEHLLNWLGRLAWRHASRSQGFDVYLFFGIVE